MNPLETADVLTAIASYDLRTVGEADVIAWHAVIGDELDKPLALEAVIIHHKSSGERIKPFHVLSVAKQIRRDRAERENADSVRRGEFEDARDQRLGLPSPALGGLPIYMDGDPVPGAYMVNDAIERACPRCGSEAGSACMNPINGKPLRMPCLSRLTNKPKIGGMP